jgi:hypothetical protein
MSKFMFQENLKASKPEKGLEKDYHTFKRDYLKARSFMENFLKKHFGECCYNEKDDYCEYCALCKAYKHLDLIYDNPFAKEQK